LKKGQWEIIQPLLPLETMGETRTGLGNPATFLLPAGNAHDSIHVIELLDKVEISGNNMLTYLAYEVRAIRANISEHVASDLIPPIANVWTPSQWTSIYTAVI